VSGTISGQNPEEKPLLAPVAALPLAGEPVPQSLCPLTVTAKIPGVKTMAAERPITKISTDPDIKAYQDYIPEDWGKNTIGPLPEGTVLERLVLDLGLSWRCTSYTAQMPATSIKAMHAAAVGRGKFVSPDSSIVAYSDRILAKLSRQVPELVENSALRARIQAALVTVTAEFRDEAAAVKEDYPVEPIWADFMQDTFFRLSLWGSQRVAYVAFYNAYEAFLVECLKVGKGVSRLRSTDKAAFNDALRTALSRDMTSPCWSHHEINIARLVRHALSHNGGRVTEHLKKQKHGVELVGDMLQIMPPHIHRMLRQLRNAVEKVIAVGKDDPKFLASADLAQPKGAEE
jgi:hypothetical protein